MDLHLLLLNCETKPSVVFSKQFKILPKIYHRIDSTLKGVDLEKSTILVHHCENTYEEEEENEYAVK